MTEKTELSNIDDDLNKNGIQELYEIKSFKAIMPQLIATLVATAFRLPLGMSLSFTGILIPEIEKENADIHATVDETSLIASITFLAMSFCSLFGGYLVDYLGRINVMRLTVLPEVGGWIFMALATNTTMLLVGRTLAGIAAALTCISSSIYISETSHPKLRGTFLTIMTLFTTIGVQLVYLEGLIMSWRSIAWTGVAYSLLLFVLTFFIPESYEWFMNKNKFNRAKASLQWFYKYQKSDTEENFVELHFALLKTRNCLKRQQNQQQKNNIFSNFLKPSVYKPFLIVIGLCLIQHFSGIYVIMAYTITIFENIGTNVSPLVASNLTTGLPILISILNLYTMKTFGRKPLLFVSCSGMALCLFISGIFTKWIHEGTTNSKWVPVVFIFMYMCFALSALETIPWYLIAELMPPEYRGGLVGIAACIASFIMFAAVQTYRKLDHYLGDIGIQFFYGTVALIGVGYVYLFVPEPHGKTLTQIEMFFSKKSKTRNENEENQQLNVMHLNNCAS